MRIRTHLICETRFEEIPPTATDFVGALYNARAERLNITEVRTHPSAMDQLFSDILRESPYPMWDHDRVYNIPVKRSTDYPENTLTLVCHRDHVIVPYEHRP